MMSKVFLMTVIHWVYMVVFIPFKDDIVRMVYCKIRIEVTHRVRKVLKMVDVRSILLLKMSYVRMVFLVMWFLNEKFRWGLEGFTFGLSKWRCEDSSIATSSSKLSFFFLHIMMIEVIFRLVSSKSYSSNCLFFLLFFGLLFLRTKLLLNLIFTLSWNK